MFGECGTVVRIDIRWVLVMIDSGEWHDRRGVRWQAQLMKSEFRNTKYECDGPDGWCESDIMMRWNSENGEIDMVMRNDECAHGQPNCFRCYLSETVYVWTQMTSDARVPWCNTSGMIADACRLLWYADDDGRMTIDDAVCFSRLFPPIMLIFR